MFLEKVRAENFPVIRRRSDKSKVVLKVSQVKLFQKMKPTPALIPQREAILYFVGEWTQKLDKLPAA